MVALKSSLSQLLIADRCFVKSATHLHPHTASQFNINHPITFFPILLIIIIIVIIIIMIIMGSRSKEADQFAGMQLHLFVKTLTPGSLQFHHHHNHHNFCHHQRHPHHQTKVSRGLDTYRQDFLPHRRRHAYHCLLSIQSNQAGSPQTTIQIPPHPQKPPSAPLDHCPQNRSSTRKSVTKRMRRAGGAVAAFEANPNTDFCPKLGHHSAACTPDVLNLAFLARTATSWVPDNSTVLSEPAHKTASSPFTLIFGSSLTCNTYLTCLEAVQIKRGSYH